MSDWEYPSSSNSSHSSRRLDSSSLMSSGSSPTIHISSGTMSSWSSRSSSPFQRFSPVPFSSVSNPVQENLVELDLEHFVSKLPSQPPSPPWLMADLQFGRCVTPTSPPTSPLPNLVENINSHTLTSPPTSPFPNSAENTTSQWTSPVVSDSSSSDEDEEPEAKRQKVDPDYVPSTTSEGTPTDSSSPPVSEREEQEIVETETEDEESWHPSRSTSPEIISSPEDD
jgi:hypothetical protein